MLRKVILYGLYIIAVGVLAGVIVKSFYPSTTNTSSTSKKPAQSKHQTVATSKQKATTPAKTPVSSPSKQNTTAPTKPTTSSSQPAPTTLENTGPGSDVGIFAVAFLAGTLGYQAYLRNRRADHIS